VPVSKVWCLSSFCHISTVDARTCVCVCVCYYQVLSNVFNVYVHADVYVHNICESTHAGLLLCM
jgi:hypothetical protein